ncbi:MAG: hypothetical protein J0H56_12310 [Micrococcales bacterium]|nr:hypothetical protein [Micrococcales bacterium]
MSDTQDLITIPISVTGQQILDDLFKVQQFFDTELDAFLASASLALALGLPALDDVGPSAGTKWNKGSGAISEWSNLVSWYLPTDEPIKALRDYGERGLRHVRDRLRQGRSFAEIFAAT